MGWRVKTDSRPAAQARRLDSDPCQSWSWGWRTQRTGKNQWAKWLPKGAPVGWLDGQNLFLDVDSAFHAEQEMLRIATLIFDEKKRPNIEQIKAVMVEKAVAGDPAAATASSQVC